MMKGNVITEKTIQQFENYLKMEEKSQNTIDKYIRDVNAFAEYLGGKCIGKEIAIAYIYGSKVVAKESHYHLWHKGCLILRDVILNKTYALNVLWI